MSPQRSEPRPRLGPASRRDLLVLAAGASLAACGTTRSSAPAGAQAPAPAGEPRADLDELFAHLVDQRPGHQPIQPEERAARRERLGAILSAAGVDAYLCEGGPTMGYLSGGGGVVSFTMKGGMAAGTRLVDALKIPKLAPSLGGVESLVEQPALMSIRTTTMANCLR